VTTTLGCQLDWFERCLENWENCFLVYLWCAFQSMISMKFSDQCGTYLPGRQHHPLGWGPRELNVEGGSLHVHESLILLEGCQFCPCPCLQTADSRFFSLWNKHTPETFQGACRPLTWTGATSLFPLFLSLPASWTEQPLALLALKPIAGHCGAIQLMMCMPT
jgi:hypothetical protein